MSVRILVVDYEVPFARMLKVILESQDYSVVTCSSAAEAVRVLADQTFDVLLTDMKMETDAAGYDVVHAARKVHHPPAIIVLTAFPLLAREWIAAGADAAVPKPIHMDSLLQLVSDLLQKRAQDATRAS